MGFFSKPKTKVKKFDLFKKLPKEIKETGKTAVKDVLGFQQERLHTGETADETALFSASRANSRRVFDDVMRQTILSLRRRGIANSGFANRAISANLHGFANMLLQQDAQRAVALTSRREQAALNSLNAILGIAGATTITAQSSPGGLGYGFLQGALSSAGEALGGFLGGIPGKKPGLGGSSGGSSGGITKTPGNFGTGD